MQCLPSISLVQLSSRQFFALLIAFLPFLQLLRFTINITSSHNFQNTFWPKWWMCSKCSGVVLMFIPCWYPALSYLQPPPHPALLLQHLQIHLDAPSHLIIRTSLLFTWTRPSRITQKSKTTNRKPVCEKTCMKPIQHTLKAPKAPRPTLDSQSPQSHRPLLPFPLKSFKVFSSTFPFPFSFLMESSTS